MSMDRLLLWRPSDDLDPILRPDNIFLNMQRNFINSDTLAVATNHDLYI